MDYTVNFREFEPDYAWNNSHASNLLAEYAQEKFAPAFEGSLTTSRFVAFLRCPGSPSGVVLCVSVSTKRIDFRHRPIRTMTFLRAENLEEAKLLAAFFAECLRKRDKQTLYDPESDIAKAVESLYQTKKPDEFLAFCRTLPLVGGNGSAQEKGIAFIPRNNYEGERQSLANALPTVIVGDSPFLFVLTDRLPTDVLGSLGSMFDHATVRIFSEAVDHREDIPEPASQKYRYAAAIGGAVLLVLLVAAIGTCSRGSRQDEANSNHSNLPGGGTVGATSTSTNRQALGRIVIPAVTNAPTKEAAVTNVPPSQNASCGACTPTITNTPPQEAKDVSSKHP